MPYDVTSASNSQLRKNLYERDYYTWTLEQARAIQERRVDALDWENLADEVGDLGKSVVRSLKSQLTRLLTHLLKWQRQATRRQSIGQPMNSWRFAIEDARREILDLLDENPGLRPRTPELFPKAYSAAIYRACRETGADKSKFPTSCPWTFEQAMDDKFWPGSEDRIPRKPTSREKKTKKRR